MSEVTQERRYLSCADTAKLVRKALKAEFPGQKFSVRSSTYSMGASISVRWTDGPTSPDVDVVLKRYEGASFDPMIDLKSYHDSLLTSENGIPELVKFGADYVMGQREISPEWRAELEAEISEYAGEPFDNNTHYAIAAPRAEGEPMAIDTHRGEYGSTLVHQLAWHRTR